MWFLSHDCCMTVRNLLVSWYACFCERTWSLCQQVSYLALFIVLKTMFQDTCWNLFSTYISMINVSQRLRDCQKATCVLICLLLWEDLKPVSTTVLPTSFYVLKLYFRTIVLDLFFTTVARLSNVYLWIYMHAVVKGIETSLYAAPLCETNDMD